MSSLTRMLSILDLFTPERPTLLADEIIGRLDCSQPTGYRYIKQLCSAGLLTGHAGVYGLGVRIIELDYQIRRCDPLLGVVQPVMAGIAGRLSCDVLLTVFFGGRVVVTHHERGADPIRVSYGRGHIMPLFRGAGSKAILAALPAARQRRLFDTAHAEIGAAGLGHDWPEFRAALSAMRKARLVTSRGELDAGNVGVAAALAVRARTPPASIVLVFNEARHDVLDARRVNGLLLEARDQVDQLLDARDRDAARAGSQSLRGEQPGAGPATRASAAPAMIGGEVADFDRPARTRGNRRTRVHYT